MVLSYILLPLIEYWREHSQRLIDQVDIRRVNEPKKALLQHPTQSFSQVFLSKVPVFTGLVQPMDVDHVRSAYV
jgi:hypothetical protein